MKDHEAEFVTDQVEQSLDRRLFLGAGAAALLGASNASFAQVPTGPELQAVPRAAPGGGRTLSQVLADYIVGFDLKKVPAPVLVRARTCFIDTVGVMLAGSRQDVARIVVDMVKLEGSAPTAAIAGASLRASPQLAAMANGVAAHAMDYDFTYLSGQAVAAVIPAILPVAETVGATAAECLSAFIIGSEVAGRIVRSNFQASSIAGWHTTGMVGVIAAAAACARLMKVPAAAIPDMIGIAVSMASGRSVNFGTMTKPLHAGHAARDGVMAAELARRGFTAHASALEGRAGYFDGFGRGLEVRFDSFRDLGHRHDLVSARFELKAYPCGGLTHTAIEAALELRERLAPRLGDIGNIHASVTRNAAQRAGTSYPDTVEAAKFSVSYLVAYALVRGAPKISAFTEEALHDEKVKAVAKTVTASVDSELGPGTDGSPAKLKVTLKGGEVIEIRRNSATGSTQTPMSQALLEEKFLDCATQAVNADAARKILAILNTITERPSLADLWPLLRVG